MPISLLQPADTRRLVKPVVLELVSLLRGLPADAWGRPAIRAGWRVRDVVAHRLDIGMRWLSFHRDGRRLS